MADAGVSIGEHACDLVHHLNRSLQCQFVQDTEDCHTDEQYLAYTTFVYCAFGSGQTGPALAVLVSALPWFLTSSSAQIPVSATATAQK